MKNYFSVRRAVPIILFLGSPRPLGEMEEGRYPQIEDLTRMLATDLTLLKALKGQVVVLNE